MYGIIAFLAGSALLLPGESAPQQPSFAGIEGRAGSVSAKGGTQEFRDRPGGIIYAREWTTWEYSVDVHMVKTSETVPLDLPSLYCKNSCSGFENHDHSECRIGTCSSRCERTHEVRATGKYKILRENWRAAARQAQQIAARIGVGGSSPLRAPGVSAAPSAWSYQFSPALQQAIRLANRRQKLKSDHWNDTPCSYSRRKVVLRKYEFQITGSFTAHIVRMERGVRSTRTEAGPKHSAVIAEIYLPEFAPAEPPRVLCFCRARSSPLPRLPSPPGDLLPCTSGGVTVDDGQGPMGPFFPSLDGLIDLGSLGKVIVEITGEDLSEVNVKAKNEGTQPLEVSLQPGLKFVPEDSRYQEMYLIDPLSFSVPPGMTVDKRARVVCLEMKKEEPHSNVRFRTAPAERDDLCALGEEMRRSPIRGPWDQAMFWILTDGATLPTINERMFPRISQGQYVNGLGSVLPWLDDETTRKLAKNVLSLDTLLATTTNPDALDTLIQTWATEMPEEFDQFLATNREAIASLFMKEAPYLIQRYLIGLATSLLNSGRSEAGIVALECLLRTTRDHLIATERELNRRVLQEAYGNLMLLVLQVALGGNANAARLAFEVLAKHHYTEGSQEVQDVSERGPTLETDLDGDGKAELTDWSTIVIRFTDEEGNLLPGGERYDTNRDGALTLDDLPPNLIEAHKAAKKAAEDLKVGA